MNFKVKFPHDMISIREVHFSFGTNQVLKGANLEIGRGETFVIIGQSGCGKSVLLKHIAGLLMPKSGEVLIDGQGISDLKHNKLNEHRKRIGVLFQGAALFDSMNVYENVSFGLHAHTKMPEEEIARTVKEKLELVGLAGIETLMPSQLSGGMRKRVGLARALSMNPEIMLYDEPTTGIDPIMADVINDLIVELDRKPNMTSVAVTHDMTSAYKIASKIAMLYLGEIIEVGTPEEIKNTKNPIVHQFTTGASKGPITHNE